MLRVDPILCTAADLGDAADWLRAGRIVAFPTDTLYGLAADAGSAEAIDRLFALKGRPAESAVPFVAASRAQVDAWCGLSDLGARLADAFWPGPLSLICDAPPRIVPAALGGRNTVAVRVPNHPVARALAYAWGAPLPATSANLSGEPPAVTVADLGPLASAPDLLIVDGGDAPGGAPSTIVDARRVTPVLIREGAIAWDRVLHSLQR